MIQTLLQVALGGAIGASARYMTNVAAMRLIGPGFPWAHNRGERRRVVPDGGASSSSSPTRTRRGSRRS